MTHHNISQVPAKQNGSFVESLNDHVLFARLIADPGLKTAPVESIMQPPFPLVEGTDTVKEVARKTGKETSAVLVRLDDDEVHIVTRHDLIGAIS